jgi:hypothetical protein
VSTKTDISTLATNFQTVTVETDSQAISTATSYITVEKDMVTFTVQAIATLSILPVDKRSPEIGDQDASAGATTSPLASLWIAAYGTSHVSCACSCIITQAAST